MVVYSCHGVSQPSFSRCIINISNTVCYCAKYFIRFPNEACQRRIQQGFQEKIAFPKYWDALVDLTYPLFHQSIDHCTSYMWWWIPIYWRGSEVAWEYSWCFYVETINNQGKNILHCPAMNCLLYSNRSKMQNINKCGD